MPDIVLARTTKTLSPHLLDGGGYWSSAVQHVEYKNNATHQRSHCKDPRLACMSCGKHCCCRTALFTLYLFCPQPGRSKHGHRCIGPRCVLRDHVVLGGCDKRHAAPFVEE